MRIEVKKTMGSAELSAPDKVDKKTLWHQIGVHRGLASFWYKFILIILAAVPALLLNSWLFPNYILPYPEALGFRSLTIGYFGLFFSIMDLATGPAAERFVAQYAEINPRKALRYTQFFIWFQAITGLIQITGISVYCFTYLVHTDLNYAMWFFLIYSLTQFPGMLGAFSSTLKGYQRFDKSNIVEILQTIVFEVITQVIFILLGRWIGGMFPEIGELYGATFGFIVGKYLDDFIAMFLSGYYVSKVLEPYGIKLRETFIPAFNMEEVKECLIYGTKLLGATLISTLTDYITLLLMTQWVPNYVAILGYIEIAKSIANLVNTRYNFSSLISEAYNNGQKNFTQYIITTYFKNWWYLAFFLTLEISMLMPRILELIGGSYGQAAWLIPIYIFPRLLVTPPVMGAEILQACDMPTYRTIGILTEKVVKMITVVAFLSPIGLVNVIGVEYIIILYAFHDIPAYIAITLVEFAFIHKKAVPVRISMWQTFGAGTLASLPMIPINLIILKILDLIHAANSSMLLLIIMVAIILFSGLFFFPLVLFFIYGLVGGWDDVSLFEFEKTVPLCGPSKFIVQFYFKITQYGHKISPLKNKFPIPHKKAYEEIEILTAMLAKMTK